MQGNVISSILGTKETAFSSVLAFLLAYHADFLAWLLAKSGMPAGLEIETITTEHCLDRPENRIDIFISFAGGYRLGIENKKWAGFQDRQVERYLGTSDFSDRQKSRIIVIAPAAYALEHVSKLKIVPIIRYREIIAWLDKHRLGNPILDDIHEFFHEVEMKPLEPDDVHVVASQTRATQKFDAILNEFRNPGRDGSIEYVSSAYRVFFRGYGQYSFYYGFRFSDVHGCQLIDGQPECFVYLKHLKGKWVDGKNIPVVKRIFASIRKDLAKSAGTQCSFTDGQIKLIIHKKIEDFYRQDNAAIVEWFCAVDRAVAKAIAGSSAK